MMAGGEWKAEVKRHSTITSAHMPSHAPSCKRQCAHVTPSPTKAAENSDYSPFRCSNFQRPNTELKFIIEMLIFISSISAA